MEPGLSYALTDEGLPDAAEVWTPAGPGPAQMASRAVGLAVDGGTVHLGQLLAALGVRYIVVVDGVDPSVALPDSVQAPPPAGLQQALLAQSDLQIVSGEFGVQVYKNEQIIPLQRRNARPRRGRSSRPHGRALRTSWGGDRCWAACRAAIRRPACSPRARSTPATHRPGVSN